MIKSVYKITTPYLIFDMSFVSGNTQVEVSASILTSEVSHVVVTDLFKLNTLTHN